ncbi:hypothetical protein M408DRAFT_86308 [Serendipita vermifera MAFF 305830]|uniref:Secreted protein n=1 Tax=Serendipita vermifera MAFF 305830 TaxID=933852 RepID=A0A0C2XYA6_SERVB|nr:hypothetical protein M408DRAFT_86308 [Serendipita vermifera MAFF 305830]
MATRTYGGFLPLIAAWLPLLQVRQGRTHETGESRFPLSASISNALHNFPANHKTVDARKQPYLWPNRGVTHGLTGTA